MIPPHEIKPDYAKAIAAWEKSTGKKVTQLPATYRAPSTKKGFNNRNAFVSKLGGDEGKKLRIAEQQPVMQQYKENFDQSPLVNTCSAFVYLEKRIHQMVSAGHLYAIYRGIKTTPPRRWSYVLKCVLEILKEIDVLKDDADDKKTAA